jgi:NAD(P)-dependent dehydrogenase (short-subunit alcohol dehydrogenase family)
MKLSRIVIPAAVVTAGGIAVGAAAGAAFATAGVLAARKAARAWMRPGIDLRGKVVLITGASRGLGLAMGREFAHAGARIAICARDAQELEEAARRIPAIPFVCDITDRESVRTLIRDVIDRFGRIDVLINNAGEISVGPFDALEREDFERAMKTMFWGPVDVTLEALPHMRTAASGHIVNITSIGGRVSVPRLLPYCCAKFALVAFSDGLAAELNREKIRVLTVVPGLMRTGSYLQGKFKGDAEGEFTWFGISGNMPGITMPASRAARQIRKAVESGRKTLTITWPAKILQRVDAVFPETTRHVMALVDEYVLPWPEGTRGMRTGHDLNQRFGRMFQAFTTLGRTAAREWNEQRRPSAVS